MAQRHIFQNCFKICWIIEIPYFCNKICGSWSLHTGQSWIGRKFLKSLCLRLKWDRVSLTRVSKKGYVSSWESVFKLNHVSGLFGRKEAMLTTFLRLWALSSFLIFSSRLGRLLNQPSPILNYSMFPLSSLQKQKVAINFLSLCTSFRLGTETVLF